MGSCLGGSFGDPLPCRALSQLFLKSSIRHVSNLYSAHHTALGLALPGSRRQSSQPLAGLDREGAHEWDLILLQTRPWLYPKGGLVDPGCHLGLQSLEQGQLAGQKPCPRRKGWRWQRAGGQMLPGCLLVQVPRPEPMLCQTNNRHGDVSGWMGSLGVLTLSLMSAFSRWLLILCLMLPRGCASLVAGARGWSPVIYGSFSPLLPEAHTPAKSMPEAGQAVSPMSLQ